jgi:hypothetical protein
MNKTNNLSTEYYEFLEKRLGRYMAREYARIEDEIYLLYRQHKDTDEQTDFLNELRDAEEKRMENRMRWLVCLERQRQIYQLYDETTPDRVQSLPEELQLHIIEYIEPQVIISRKLGFITKQLNWCRGYLFPVVALEERLKDLPLRVIHKLFNKYNLFELKNCPKKQDTLRSLLDLASYQFISYDEINPVINFTDPSIGIDINYMDRVKRLFKLLLSFKVFLEIKGRLVKEKKKNKSKIDILNSGSSI